MVEHGKLVTFFKPHLESWNSSVRKLSSVIHDPGKYTSCSGTLRFCPLAVSFLLKHMSALMFSTRLYRCRIKMASAVSFIK